MIPLNFYRDNEYVYYNNPNGITKKMTISDFEAMMSDESELPAYTSSDGGKVLTVNSGGTGLEWGEVSGGNDFRVHITTSGDTMTSASPFSSIAEAMEAHKFVYVTIDGSSESMSDQIFGFVQYTEAAPEDNEYNVSIIVIASYGIENIVFSCDSASGYPSYTET